jgi:hypothetical protein
MAAGTAPGAVMAGAAAAGAGGTAAGIGSADPAPHGVLLDKAIFYEI